jgi:HPt (histidine-containing phosphotransfer) domain-containing protein
MPVPRIDDQGSDSTTAGMHSSMYKIDELLRRCIGDHSLAANLIDRFTARLPLTLQDIERAITDNDWSRAASIVHNLKGEAGSLSATQLQIDAASLEDCLRAARFGEADIHFRRLKSTAERCLIARPATLNC